MLKGFLSLLTGILFTLAVLAFTLLDPTPSVTPDWDPPHAPSLDMKDGCFYQHYYNQRGIHSAEKVDALACLNQAEMTSIENGKLSPAAATKMRAAHDYYLKAFAKWEQDKTEFTREYHHPWENVKRKWKDLQQQAVSATRWAKAHLL